MTKDQNTLLLFLETCCVDTGGKVRSRHMNKDDIEIAKNWNKDGFIKFGRIKFHDISNGFTHYCIFSDKAWYEAHKLREERGRRNKFKIE